jgi:hypothetical protein
VLEARVHRARVNKVSPCKLPDSPQALKSWLLDNTSLPIVDLDETMDWATNFVFAMGVYHQRLKPPVDPFILQWIEEKAKVLFHLPPLSCAAHPDR